MVQYDAQLQPLLDLVSDALATVVEGGGRLIFMGKNWRRSPQASYGRRTPEELKQICRKYGPTLKVITLSAHSSRTPELNAGVQSIEALEQQEKSQHIL